jgi:redox-sensitive bicupin YhaK (pirin superfamily)
VSSQPRRVEKVITPRWVMDGADVRLLRSIATPEMDQLDPFLLFDQFGSAYDEDPVRGFPMHPHRGIETVTYVLAGLVEHIDSAGNRGQLGPGDVLWITAGRGIMHEERFHRGPRGLCGVQLWVNLPADMKMTEPRYREVTSDRIPEVLRQDGARIRVIAGRSDGLKGAITDGVGGVALLDVSLPGGARLEQPVGRGRAAFAYVWEGEAAFGVGGGERGTSARGPKLVVLADGEDVAVRASPEGVRFLLASATPLREPIVRHGSFVMNTREEIDETLEELRAGTFPR